MPLDERKRVGEEVEKWGLPAVANRIGISPNTLARCLIGARCYYGTLVLVRRALGIDIPPRTGR